MAPCCGCKGKGRGCVDFKCASNSKACVNCHSDCRNPHNSLNIVVSVPSIPATAEESSIDTAVSDFSGVAHKILVPTEISSPNFSPMSTAPFKWGKVDRILVVSQVSEAYEALPSFRNNVCVLASQWPRRHRLG